jgi:O-antigen/teichoic acid export membrane protein
VGFGLQLVLARYLGPEQFGVYAYAMGWLSLALLFGKLDLDNAATRYIGAYAGNGEWALASGFVRRVPLLVLAASSAVALIVGVTVHFVARQRGIETPPVLWAACLLLPATGVMQLLSNVLQGFRRVVASQAPPSVIRPVLFAGMLLSYGALVQGHPFAAVAVYANLAATLVVIGVQIGLVWVRFKPHAAKGHQYATRAWLKTASGLLAVSIAQLVLSGQTDVVVVGSVLSKVEAGSYSIASQLANAVHMGITAVVFVAAPTIAHLYHTGAKRDLQQLVTRVGQANLLLTLPALLTLLILGKPILALFGPTFPAAYPILVVLSLVTLQGAAGGAVCGFLLTMTGHEKVAALIIGVAAIVYAGLVVVLSPRFGAVGVAMATLIAYVLRAIWLGIYVHRRLGINVLKVWGHGAAT